MNVEHRGATSMLLNREYIADVIVKTWVKAHSSMLFILINVYSCPGSKHDEHFPVFLGLLLSTYDYLNQHCVQGMDLTPN